MADNVINPANVLSSGPNATVGRGIAGASLTAGQWLYQDPTEGTYKPGSANGPSPAFKFAGIAQHASSPGQPIQFVIQDSAFQPGFPIAAGDSVITSANPGAIAPETDKVSGWYVTNLGVGSGNDKINLNPTAAGVPIP